MSKIKIVKYTNGKYVAKRRILGMIWIKMRRSDNEYLFDDPDYLHRLVERYTSDKKEQKVKRIKPREVYIWRRYVY